MSIVLQVDDCGKLEQTRIPAMVKKVGGSPSPAHRSSSVGTTRSRRRCLRPRANRCVAIRKEFAPETSPTK